MTSDHFYYPSIICFVLLGIASAFFAIEVFYFRSRGRKVGEGDSSENYSPTHGKGWMVQKLGAA